MTDKVQKIREEVERLKIQNETYVDKEYTDSEKWSKHGAYHILFKLLDFIDSLPEEPVSDDFTKALAECIHQAQWNVVDPMAHAEIWKDELIKLAKSKEPASEEWIKELRTKLDSLSKEDFEKVWEKYGAEEKEETVSEDLEEASKEWLRPQLDKSYVNYGEVKMMELTHFDGYAMLDAIEFGAKWQKAKDQSITEDLGEYINELSKQFPEVSFAKLSRIAVRVAKWQKERDEDEIRIIRELLDNFDKTCDEYHDAGFKHGQEALMKDATETTVHIGAGNYPYIPQIELYDYDKDIPLAKEGDKYKVVLIKED